MAVTSARGVMSNAKFSARVPAGALRPAMMQRLKAERVKREAEAASK